MNPHYLSVDEFQVECAVRNISGSLMEQLKLLGSALKLESTGAALAPDKPHNSARKAPQREYNLCSNKLKQLKPKLNAIVEMDGEERQDKTKIIFTEVLHIIGRLQRLGKASPSCREQCTQLIKAGDKVLEAISSLIDSKLSRDDFEKSVVAALPCSPPPSHYETNNETSDSEIEEIVLPPANPPSVMFDHSKNNVIPHLNQPQEEIKSFQPQVRGPSQNLGASSSKKIPSLYGSTENEILPISAKPLNNHISPQELAQFVELARRISLSDKNPTHAKPLDLDQVKISTPESKPSGNQHFHPRDSTYPAPNHFYEKPTSHHDHAPQLPIHKWNIVFDGTPYGSPIERFLYRVEHLANSNRIPLTKLVNDLHILLRKTALEWYWSYLQRNGEVQWGNLAREMRSRFQDRKTDFEIRQAIAARKQKPRQNFLEFYSELLDSTLSLNEPLPETEIFLILRQNMSSELQLKLAGRKISSVAELVNQCVEIEDTWKRVNQYQESHRKYVHELNEIPVMSHSPENLDWRSQCQYDDPSVYDFSANANFNPLVEVRQRPSEVNAISNDRRPRFSSAVASGPRLSNYSSQHNSGPVKYCYGCGAPNVVKPYCRNCNPSLTGNQQREMQRPGVHFTKEMPRNPSAEAATNTCPELYRRNP